jgi:hypothetical protein
MNERHFSRNDTWQRQGTRPNYGSARRAEHHGTVLICVLACLAIVTATVAMTAQSALRIRNEARTQRQLLQTQFLCEAGMLRAKQKLQELPSYSGEEWSPDLSPTSFEVVFITIQVEATDLDSTRLVKVVAKLAEKASSARLIQQSHQFKMTVVDSIPKENK